ncbi:hypothetical protein ES703_90892 [subsurface metagenome]
MIRISVTELPGAIGKTEAFCIEGHICIHAVDIPGCDNYSNRQHSRGLSGKHRIERSKGLSGDIDFVIRLAFVGVDLKRYTGIVIHVIVALNEFIGCHRRALVLQWPHKPCETAANVFLGRGYFIYKLFIGVDLGHGRCLPGTGCTAPPDDGIAVGQTNGISPGQGQNIRVVPELPDHGCGLVYFVKGIFNRLSTNYNWVTKQLRATMTQFGEFIFCFLDLEEVANSPILIEPEDQGTVNQEFPVSFFWTPRGFARWNHLQVATDANFTALVVDESWMTESRYTWSSADPNATYYWRVKITNYGGDSEWSSGSFATVPLIMVQVTAPNGGENWKRGLTYFVRWNDNIDEDVVLELYKDDTFVQTIDTVSSTGVYEWEVDLALEPGCDYSIKVKSSTNGALFDMSDDAFSIDVPPGDFDCDGCVQLDDLAVLTDEWLEEQSGLIADLYDNDKVDFYDFAIFAENWTGTSCP